MVNSGIINGTRSTPPDLPPRAPSPILPSAVVSQGYSNIWCTADIATAHQSSVKHLTCSANNKKGIFINFRICISHKLTKYIY